MGVLEDAKIKSVKKVRVNDPRILGIEEKASLIAQTPVSVSFHNVGINEKGFYNNEDSEGDICLPEAATGLKDDELLSLILTESLLSTSKASENQLLYLRICNGFRVLCAYASILCIFIILCLVCELFFFGILKNLSLLFELAGIFLDRPSVYDLYRCIVSAAVAGSAAFLVYCGLSSLKRFGVLYKADKETIEGTGNKGALINALTFMKDNERDTKKRALIDKRIAKLSKDLSLSVRAEDLRVLEFEKLISRITRIPITVYFDDISVNEKGFYNDRPSEGHICIPEAAAGLQDEELLSLILAESLFSSAKAGKKQLPAPLISESFVWFLIALIMIIITCYIMGMSSVGGFSRVIGELISGNYMVLIPVAVVITCCFALAVRSNERSLHKIALQQADKTTVKKTGNKQALLNALNFMRDNERDAKKRQIIDKRIESASKI